MIPTEVVENMTTHILCFSNFFSEILPLMRICEKLLGGGAGHLAKWRMRIATNTHIQSV